MRVWLIFTPVTYISPNQFRSERNHITNNPVQVVNRIRYGGPTGMSSKMLKMKSVYIPLNLLCNQWPNIHDLIIRRNYVVRKYIYLAFQSNVENIVIRISLPLMCNFTNMLWIWNILKNKNPNVTVLQIRLQVNTMIIQWSTLMSSIHIRIFPFLASAF